MKTCVESTGGLCLLADEFKQSVFKESFRGVFARYVRTYAYSFPVAASNATYMHPYASRDFVHTHMVFPCEAHSTYANPYAGTRRSRRRVWTTDTS